MMMYSSRDPSQAVNVISLRHYPARSDETVRARNAAPARQPAMTIYPFPLSRVPTSPAPSSPSNNLQPLSLSNAQQQPTPSTIDAIHIPTTQALDAWHLGEPDYSQRYPNSPSTVACVPHSSALPGSSLLTSKPRVSQTLQNHNHHHHVGTPLQG